MTWQDMPREGAAASPSPAAAQLSENRALQETVAARLAVVERELELLSALSLSLSRATATPAESSQALYMSLPFFARDGGRIVERYHLDPWRWARFALRSQGRGRQLVVVQPPAPPAERAQLQRTLPPLPRSAFSQAAPPSPNPLWTVPKAASSRKRRRSDTSRSSAVEAVGSGSGGVEAQLRAAYDPLPQLEGITFSPSPARLVKVSGCRQISLVDLAGQLQSILARHSCWIDTPFTAYSTHPHLMYVTALSQLVVAAMVEYTGEDLIRRLRQLLAIPNSSNTMTMLSEALTMRGAADCCDVDLTGTETVASVKLLQRRATGSTTAAHLHSPEGSGALMSRRGAGGAVTFHDRVAVSIAVKAGLLEAFRPFPNDTQALYLALVGVVPAADPSSLWETAAVRAGGAAAGKAKV